jgi:hypothetical protein
LRSTSGVKKEKEETTDKGKGKQKGGKSKPKPPVKDQEMTGEDPSFLLCLSGSNDPAVEPKSHAATSDDDQPFEITRVTVKGKGASPPDLLSMTDSLYQVQSPRCLRLSQIRWR